MGVRAASRFVARFAVRGLPAGMAPLVFVLASACGGDGGGGSPTAPPQRVSESFTGTTTSNATGGCSAEGHAYFVAADSSVEVRLETSGDPTLRVQVCANGIDNNDCTINLTSIAVGASVSGVRKGAQNQSVSFRRLGCTGGAPNVPGTISYTATITYQRP